MARLRDYEAMETEELLSIVANPRSTLAQRTDALVALRRRGISQLQARRMIADRQRGATGRGRNTLIAGEDTPEAVAQRDASGRRRSAPIAGEDTPEVVAPRNAMTLRNQEVAVGAEPGVDAPPRSPALPLPPTLRNQEVAVGAEPGVDAPPRSPALPLPPTLRNQEVAVGAEPGVDAPPRSPALPLPPTPPRQPPRPRPRREEVSADRLNEFSLALARGTPIDEAALTAAERKALETMRKRMGLAFTRGGRIPAPVREGVPRRVGKLPTRIKLR